jgi:hypothetical protein
MAGFEPFGGDSLNVEFCREVSIEEEDFLFSLLRPKPFKPPKPPS